MTFMEDCHIKHENTFFETATMPDLFIYVINMLKRLKQIGYPFFHRYIINENNCFNKE